MKKPIFLELDEIISIHRDQIERYGGKSGIRDIELLRSAVAMPCAGFSDDYVHTDIFEMASAYLFHIIRNHPFVDGNKRTGAVAAVVFLMMNGIELQVGEEDFEYMVRAVAEGKMNKSEIADFFRKNSSIKKQ